jgi:Ni,Fe-hydrogenase I small subunit
MLKKSASGVLASLRGPEELEGIFPSPRIIIWMNGHTKCGCTSSPLRSLRPCWTAFLSILPVILHYQPTYDQWTLPRKN